MLLMGGGCAACVSCLDLGEDKKEDARTKTAYFGFDTEKTQPAVPAAIPFDTLEDPEDFTDSTEKTLELFRELMDFRSDPDFHRMGFGRRDNEYGRWLTRVEALDELTVLMDIDLGPSRLIYLAQDYMLNEGKSASGASKQAELLFGNLTGISPGTEALNSSELVEREIQWYVIHPCYQLAAQNLGLSLEDATRIFKSELDFVASELRIVVGHEQYARGIIYESAVNECNEFTLRE